MERVYLDLESGTFLKKEELSLTDNNSIIISTYFIDEGLTNSDTYMYYSYMFSNGRTFRVYDLGLTSELINGSINWDYGLSQSLVEYLANTYGLTEKELSELGSINNIDTYISKEFFENTRVFENGTLKLALS